MSPTAAGDKITATVKDNTGTEITSGVSYSWKIDSKEVSTTASYTVKDADAGKTITVSAKVGDVDATSATATVKAAATEEDDGKPDLKVSYSADAPVSGIKVAGSSLAGATTTAGATTVVTKKDAFANKTSELSFTVTKLNGYTGDLKVTMGGVDVTDKLTTSSPSYTESHLTDTLYEVTYTLAKVTGDVEITSAATKNATYTITVPSNIFTGNALDANDVQMKDGVNSPSIDYPNIKNGTKTSPLAKIATAGATYDVWEIKAVAGETVVITDSISATGTVEVADGVYGYANGSDTVTFVMPAKNVTLTKLPGGSSDEALYTVKAGTGITLSGWKDGSDNAVTPKAGESAGEYLVPDGTVFAVAFDGTKAMGYFTTTDAKTHDATEGNLKTTSGTVTVSSADVNVYAGTIVGVAADVKAAYKDANGTTQTLPADDQIIVAIETALTVAPATNKATGVLAVAKGTGYPNIASGANIAGTWAVPAVETKLFGAVKVELENVTATANKKAVKSGDYVFAGANVEKNQTTTDDDKLSLTSTKGTTVITLAKATDVIGKEAASTLKTFDVKFYSAVSVEGVAGEKLYIGNADFAKGTVISDNLSTAALVLPNTTFYVKAATAGFVMSGEDSDGNEVALTEGAAASDNCKTYSFSTGTKDITLTEAAVADNSKVKVNIVGYGVTPIDENSNYTWGTLVTALKASRPAFDYEEKTVGTWMKVDGEMKSASDTLAAVNALTAGQSIDIDFGYYKVSKTVTVTDSSTTFKGLATWTLKADLANDLYIKSGAEVTLTLSAKPSADVEDATVFAAVTQTSDVKAVITGGAKAKVLDAADVTKADGTTVEITVTIADDGGTNAVSGDIALTITLTDT